MKVSIILPTLNRDEYLEDVLSDLRVQDTPYSFEIIVGDQNSLPLERRNQKLFSLSKKEQIKWVRFPGKNVVLARNKGIDIAKGEILIFLDDDIRIEDKDFINKHIAAYGNDSDNVAAVCGREVNPDGAEFSYKINYDREKPISDIFFFPRNYYKRIKATILSTCNCSIKKKPLTDVGCFDGNFSGASYGDDADLALRFTEKGYQIFYDSQPVVLHLLASKGGLRFSDKNNPFNHSEKIISAWVFYFKHIYKKNKEFSRHYIYRHILRKTILLKSNLLRPWRLPAVFFGLVKAFFIARKIVSKD